MRQLSFLGVVILLIASTYGDPNPEEPSSGSAGHHGSVQSGSATGQFLLTNNENYGLQISHSPYTSEQEVLPKSQKLRRRGPQNRSLDPPTPVATNGETYCAGCLPLTPAGEQQQQPIQSSNDLRPQPVPENTNGVNIRQQLRRQHHQYQQEPEQQNQQVTFSSGHNSGSGVQRQVQVQQPDSDYTYFVNKLGNAGQSTQGEYQPPSNNARGWTSSNWNQEPQPQAKLTPPQQTQQQQYQWGQKVVRPRQRQSKQSSLPQPTSQQNLNGSPATVQHLRINDDGGYSFGYKAPDSSRQEQRSMDGIVSGSYAYTDPTGQEVQVDYRATPEQGYQVSGPTTRSVIPTSKPVPVSKYQVSGPIQDTPEVQAARAQFFETYNQQLKFLEQAHAEAKGRETWAVPFGTQTQPGSTSTTNEQDSDSDSSTDKKNQDVENVDSANKKKIESNATDDDEAEDAAQTKKPIDFKLLPEPIAVPDSNAPSRGAETEEDDEQENDGVAVNREDEEPSSVPAAVKVPRKRVKGPPQSQNINQDGPQASYSFSVMVGKDQGQNQGGRGVQNQNQWPYWGSQGQNEQQAQSQPQPFTVGYQYLPPPMGQRQQSVQGSNNAATMPNNFRASYNFKQMVGGGVPAPQPWAYGNTNQPQQMPMSQQMVSSQNQNQVEMGDTTKPTSPAYFYYVSVGGNPQDYVTSNNMFNSAYPTSLKASLIGAIPQDGRHDAQVPHQNMGMIQNEVGTRTNPPVYLDMDPKMTYQGYKSSSNQDNQNQPLAIVGFIPGALVSLRNGGYVSVNSAAVAHSGNGAGGGGTSIQIGNNPSPNGNGARHQFPLFVFRDRD